MNYRRLGRTGLQVSEISLGTVELGLAYGIPIAGEHLRPSPHEAARLLNRALDLGINLIDTAPAYGESEAIIGRALRTRRNEYILATKVGPVSEDECAGRSLRQWIEASIAASLRALQTDVIDLLQVHSATVDVIRSGEVLAILQDVQRAGHIRFIGVTTYGEAAPLAALEDGHYDCLQVAYNLLDRQADLCVLPLAQRMDVGILARSVLLKGALTHRYVHLPAELNDLKAAVEHLHTVAARHGLCLPEVAYRFVLSHPAVNTALVGTARLAELNAELGYATHDTLSPTLLADLQTVAVHDRDQLNIP